MPAFATSREHVLAELHRAEFLVRVQAERLRQSPDGDAAVTPAEAPKPSEPVDLAQADALLERLGSDIAASVRESAAQGISLRLETLAHGFGLGRFDVEVLLAALLPELERGVGELYAQLQGYENKRLPSVDVLLGLLATDAELRSIARARFAPDAPLLRHGLVHLLPEAPGAPLLARAVKVDGRIVEFLQDSDAPDARLTLFTRLAEPQVRLEDLILPDALKEQLSRFARQQDGRGGPAPIISLTGASGVGKQVTAEALCQEQGLPMLVVDCAVLAVAGLELPGTLLSLLGREAILQSAALYWKNADALASEAPPLWRPAFLEALAAHPGPSFLSGRLGLEPKGVLGGRAFIQVELPRPGVPEQRRLWEAALAGAPVSASVDFEMLTSTFRLTGGQIRDAAAAARNLARFREPERDTVTQEDLATACRTQSTPRLSTLARKVGSRARWDDVVLPPERKELLEEISLHVQHRGRVMGAWGFDDKLTSGKGISALFSGPPGTGKTMAAGALVGALGLDLYQVDLSAVVSKYIGETEKQLGRLFDEAEGSSAVLFFDEADALFGKRTEVNDSHDRNANLETSYLLQRIEAYDGLVILATNFSKNMDEAFVRRFRFIIDFPLPGEEERRHIWERIFPTGMPRGADLDLDFLARRFELAGAYIRNIALRAAFLAAAEGEGVWLRHVLGAARREYQKMGKVMDGSHFAPPAAQ
jgi:ATP-dependent 26S proteasome regulatory subunit